ncbi:MAG: hypothetical protein QXU98_04130 [Candidatus Parvarchaeota archaeon]
MNNLKIIRKDNATFKLDIDHHRHNAISYLNFKYKWLSHYFKDLIPAKFIIYKTHKGYHIYIYTKAKLDNKSIILMQTALGSDWLREIRNLYRIETKMTNNWNILFSFKNDKLNEKYFATYTIKKSV